jgi:hypothetical protein
MFAGWFSLLHVLSGGVPESLEFRQTGGQV